MTAMEKVNLTFATNELGGSVKAVPITEKLRETQLRWFGHVKRSEACRGNRALNLEVDGNRRVGRPRTIWMDIIQKDLISCRVSEELAQDRLEWRRTQKS